MPNQSSSKTQSLKDRNTQRQTDRQKREVKEGREWDGENLSELRGYWGDTLSVLPANLITPDAFFSAFFFSQLINLKAKTSKFSILSQTKCQKHLSRKPSVLFQ